MRPLDVDASRVFEGSELVVHVGVVGLVRLRFGLWLLALAARVLRMDVRVEWPNQESEA
jgi:hypothetical protein